jgi:hypothetical protein
MAENQISTLESNVNRAWKEFSDLYDLPVLRFKVFVEKGLLRLVGKGRYEIKDPVLRFAVVDSSIYYSSDEEKLKKGGWNAVLPEYLRGILMINLISKEGNLESFKATLDDRFGSLIYYLVTEEKFVVERDFISKKFN